MRDVTTSGPALYTFFSPSIFPFKTLKQCRNNELGNICAMFNVCLKLWVIDSMTAKTTSAFFFSLVFYYLAKYLADT